MAYKVFTNGATLPASDLNTYLMNQSVMVFADSAARATALTSPTEGMVTYLEDTNKLYVYNGSSWVTDSSPITTQGDLIIGDASGLESRLAIGTNGKVLQSNGTTASWETPASAGWTLLSTTALSGASTVNVTGISTSYKDLRILVDQAQMGSNSTIVCSLRDSGGSTMGLVYSGISVATTPVLARRDQNTLEVPVGGGTISSAGKTSFELFISNYANTTTQRPFYYNGRTNVGGTTGGLAAWGSLTDDVAMEYFRIVGGVNFTGGNIYIYGAN